jgi:hypothetical protein
MSLKSDLAAGLIGLRRLKILQILREAVAYTLTETVLRGSLEAAGYPVSVSDLRADFVHLRDRDCIHTDMPAGVWIATLTRTGGDVAQGLEEVDGVAKPGPGA